MIASAKSYYLEKFPWWYGKMVNVAVSAKTGKRSASQVGGTEAGPSREEQ